MEKIVRRRKIEREDRVQPSTIEQLLRKYALENKDIFDYLDKLADKVTELERRVGE